MRVSGVNQSEKMLAFIHAHTDLRFGHGFNLHWYEIVLLPLAWMVVYPDKVWGGCFRTQARCTKLFCYRFAYRRNDPVDANVCLQDLVHAARAGIILFDPAADFDFCAAMNSAKADTTHSEL